MSRVNSLRDSRIMLVMGSSIDGEEAGRMVRRSADKMWNFARKK